MFDMIGDFKDRGARGQPVSFTHSDRVLYPGLELLVGLPTEDDGIAYMKATYVRRINGVKHEVILSGDYDYMRKKAGQTVVAENNALYWDPMEPLPRELLRMVL